MKIAPKRAAHHQRDRSKTRAHAIKQLRLTCRLGAAFAGGVSMVSIRRYIHEVRSSPSFASFAALSSRSLSCSGRIVCVGSATKMARDTTATTNARRTNQVNTGRRITPTSSGPTMYGSRYGQTHHGVNGNARSHSIHVVIVEAAP